jgi:FAD/FMN-containing dehydrogenase
MTETTAIRGFAGELVSPGDAAYDSHREIWNAMVDRRPGLIARCTTADDVAAAIRHGRDAGLEIAIKCGGIASSGTGFQRAV